MQASHVRKRMPVAALTDPKIIVPAIGSAFAKLDPRTLVKNPVMFVVEVVAALATVLFIRDITSGGAKSRLRVPDHRLALVHDPVRELCRSRRGRARQGAGVHASADPRGDQGQAHRRREDGADRADTGEQARARPNRAGRSR